MKRLGTIAALSVVVALGLAVGYFRLAAPQIKQFPPGWYYGQKGGKIVPEGRVNSMICLARIDQFLCPIEGTRRTLGPVEVRNDEHGALYLVFPNSLLDHSAVIYRCDNESHRLLWKAVDYNSP